MYQELTPTLLLGGPLDGIPWAVDPHETPLVTHDVPGGGYRRVAIATGHPDTGTPEHRVFYAHEELQGSELVTRALLDWEAGPLTLPVDLTPAAPTQDAAADPSSPTDLAAAVPDTLPATAPKPLAPTSPD